MQLTSGGGHVNPVLAGRIQGFGNVNPPAVEEDTGATVAKRAVGRLGDMVGEEVMLTVEDFREKGAVGAVKDAVADAGDILIDGVAAVVGWVRGDPQLEPEDAELQHNEDAALALSHGPPGSAYGVTQASPTGGINAVWVMPEDADPAALAQLVLQQQTEQQNNPLASQMADPRVPRNIQPYDPTLREPRPPLGSAASIAALSAGLGGAGSFNGHGIDISPYEPAPSGTTATASAVAAALMGPRPALNLGGASAVNNRWGPAGYQPGPGGGWASSPSTSSSSAKGLVERIAKGEVLADAASAKRLVSQCGALKVLASELAGTICERARRLYLGLDAGDPAEADKALLRLLRLAAALAELGSDFAREAVVGIVREIHEELGSLRSCELHRKEAEPLLRRLDSLGDGKVSVGGSTAPPEDLLQDAESEVFVDLLGGSTQPRNVAQQSGPTADAARDKDMHELDLLVGAAEREDLLGGDASSASRLAADDDLNALDPMHVGISEPVGRRDARTAASIGSLLDTPAPDPVPVLESLSLEGVVGLPTSADGATSQLQCMSGLPSRAREAHNRQPGDAFGFVGDEMSKAGGPA